MKTTYTHYRDALASALKQRKMLLRTQRNMKDAQRMAQTCMLVESFLQRVPSNESVKAFIKMHYARVVDLVPRRTANDSRVQLFQKLANA
jgi:hypothetical protein